MIGTIITPILRMKKLRIKEIDSHGLKVIVIDFESEIRIRTYHMNRILQLLNIQDHMFISYLLFLNSGTRALLCDVLSKVPNIKTKE